MNGRTIFRVVAALLLIAVAVGLGTAAYNAGVSAGLDEAARAAAASGAPAPVAYPYGPYWHGPWGFGFFGIIFFVFGIFLFFGLLRAIFGWGRWSGRGPGGHWRGGWDGPGGRREMVEEWHRELHRRDETGQATGGAAPGS